MPSNAIDSLLLKDMYGSDELRQVFTDEAMVQCWLDYEAALARAEADLGLVPRAAADEITSKARVEYIDLERLRQGIHDATHELVPLIWQLAELCEGDAGGWVHWGATTQDVTDSGLMMQLKRAHGIILSDLKKMDATLAALAKRERNTIMPGRTHGQHTPPITFGFKVAGWLDEVRRHIERLDAMAPRVFVGQFAGAAGTLASVGGMGLAIQQRLLADLGLGVPAIGWHQSRDRIAEYGSTLGMVAATMGRIAHEVILLQKSEVAELEEPYQRGKVGSSTMPHKRNPMICEGIVAEARMARGLVPTLMGAMESEHERDWAAVHIEWAVAPELSILTGGAVAHTLRVIEGLLVYPQRMRRNLDLLFGLPLSEAVMLRLGEALGRQAAHEVVYDASMKAFEQERPLAELLMEDSRVTVHLTWAAIEEMLRPENYTGLSGEFVDRVAG